MWPDWTLYGMAMLAACLFGGLCYPMVKEVNADRRCWWLRRQQRRDHDRWMARRAQFAREAGR